MNKNIIALFLSVFVIAMNANAASKPTGSRFDPRNQMISYNPSDTTVINSAAGYVSVLVFDDDEKVIETDVGFEQGWNIRSSENKVYIKVTPVTQTIEAINDDGETEQKQMVFDPESDLNQFKTNLFIVTTKRNYSVELNAKTFKEPEKISFVVNYRYPNEVRKEKEKLEQQRIAELKRKQEINEINKSFENAKVPRNWKYYQRVANNSEYIKPDYAYDDGRFTYFGFNPSKKIPSVFVQYGEQETITNPTVEKKGDYTVVIIHQTNDRWVLRSGDQVVGVENKGYGLVRLADSDTVSPDVKKEIKND